MTDHELAEEIEGYLEKAPNSTMVLGYDPKIWQQIIAALRSVPAQGMVIEAAKALVPHLINGWDQDDHPNDIAAADAAVDALISAVNALSAASQEKPE